MQQQQPYQLPPEAVQDLHAALQQCNHVEQIAQKAEQCGEDCRAQLAACAALRQRISMKLHHFGGVRRDA